MFSIIKKIFRIRNYCIMCATRGVKIGFRCNKCKQITCQDCVDQGITQCAWWACEEKPKEIEPIIRQPASRPLQYEEYIPQRHYWTTTASDSTDANNMYLPAGWNDRLYYDENFLLRRELRRI